MWTTFSEKMHMRIASIIEHNDVVCSYVGTLFMLLRTFAVFAYVKIIINVSCNKHIVNEAALKIHSGIIGHSNSENKIQLLKFLEICFN